MDSRIGKGIELFCGLSFGGMFDVVMGKLLCGVRLRWVNDLRKVFRREFEMMKKRRLVRR